MEAVIVSQTHGTESHVDGNPDIYHDDVRKEFILINKNISYYIYEERRYAEVHEKFRMSKHKEGHKSEYHQKNSRIHHIC